MSVGIANYLGANFYRNLCPPKTISVTIEKDLTELEELFLSMLLGFFINQSFQCSFSSVGFLCIISAFFKIF